MTKSIAGTAKTMYYYIICVTLKGEGRVVKGPPRPPTPNPPSTPPPKKNQTNSQGKVAEIDLGLLWQTKSFLGPFHKNINGYRYAQIKLKVIIKPLYLSSSFLSKGRQEWIVIFSVRWHSPFSITASIIQSLHLNINIKLSNSKLDYIVPPETANNV